MIFLLDICSSLLILHMQLVWIYMFGFVEFFFFKLKKHNFETNWLEISKFFFLFNFILGKSEHVPNPIAIVITLVLMWWAFFIIFGFCILGEMVTNRFDTFYETLCNTDWYLFPTELKRTLVTFMTIVQKSATIRGSGNIVCKLAAFKKVNFASSQDKNILIRKPRSNLTVTNRLRTRHFSILWSYANSNSRIPLFFDLLGVIVHDKLWTRDGQAPFALEEWANCILAEEGARKILQTE